MITLHVRLPGFFILWASIFRFRGDFDLCEGEKRAYLEGVNHLFEDMSLAIKTRFDPAKDVISWH